MGTLCCTAALAAGGSENALTNLRDDFASHRSVQLEATATVHMDVESGGYEVTSQVHYACEGDRFAVRQWSQTPSGEWTPFMSTGWDGDTAWRVDQSGTMLTHWTLPQPAQPGSMANPLYLAASFLGGDLVLPGVIVTAADVSGASVWDEAIDRSHIAEDGHIVVPFTDETAAQIARAVSEGDPGALRVQGGWFELVPSNTDGFALSKLMLKSPRGDSIVEIAFHGELIAYENGQERSWPSRVVCSMMQGDVPVVEVVYDMQRINHTLDPEQFSPRFAGVQTVLDGDAPRPPV